MFSLCHDQLIGRHNKPTLRHGTSSRSGRASVETWKTFAAPNLLRRVKDGKLAAHVTMLCLHLGLHCVEGITDEHICASVDKASEQSK